MHKDSSRSSGQILRLRGFTSNASAPLGPSRKHWRHRSWKQVHQAKFYSAATAGIIPEKERTNCRTGAKRRLRRLSKGAFREILQLKEQLRKQAELADMMNGQLRTYKEQQMSQLMTTQEELEHWRHQDANGAQLYPKPNMISIMQDALRSLVPSSHIIRRRPERQ